MKKILVIEDDKLIQKATQFLFKSFKCEVEFVSTGSEALVNLTQKNYDIVFLDLGLPDMSGLELAKKIRRNKKLVNIRLIALTAHSAELKHECQAVGIREFYTKPLKESEIAKILDSAHI